MASIKDRFKNQLCAPGDHKDIIESRYRRLDGTVEINRKSADYRLPAERDRDRILYSSSFRRLGEITQVIPRERGYTLHNRLTHSLKVAQLGRRMAERLLLGENSSKQKEALELANKLGGLDPNVVETAALAHDLGHPPFGHIIEEFLDKQLESETSDGYEGNAQTFRIITFLENRCTAAKFSTGLNLTLASINATLKYPWERGGKGSGKKAHKFGFYSKSSPDKDHFATVRKSLSPHCGGDGCRSIEAELMDWADDIAYAIYDIDDFYRAGLIPLDKILRECWDLRGEAHKIDEDGEMNFFFKETQARWIAQERKDSEIGKLSEDFEIFGSFLQDISFSNKALADSSNSVNKAMLVLRAGFRGTDEQKRALALLTSALVEKFASAIELNEAAVSNSLEPKVTIDPKAKTVVKILKELTWTYVIDSHDLHAVQWGQREIVERIYNTLLDARINDSKLLPKNIRTEIEMSEGSGRRRLISDIVAGMTESQIADLYGRITGVSPGSLLRTSYTS